jgi:ribonuclease HI
MVVRAYVDGSSRGNPGPGGWGVVLEFDAPGGVVRRELSGGVERTTNNTMELMAVVRAVGALKCGCLLHVFTDSLTVLNWLTGRSVVNQEVHRVLLDGLRVVAREKGVTLFVEHVRGHSGDVGNERANALAQGESARVLRGVVG